MLTELLMADQPPRAEDPKQTTTGDNLLLELADRFGVARETTELPVRIRPRHRPRPTR